MTKAAEPAATPGRATRFWHWCRANPATPIIALGGATAGAWCAVAFELGPEDLAVWKRFFGGALAGAWMAMFALGFRLFD